LCSSLIGDMTKAAGPGRGSAPSAMAVGIAPSVAIYRLLRTDFIGGDVTLNARKFRLFFSWLSDISASEEPFWCSEFVGDSAVPK